MSVRYFRTPQFASTDFGISERKSIDVLEVSTLDAGKYSGRYCSCFEFNSGVSGLYARSKAGTIIITSRAGYVVESVGGVDAVNLTRGILMVRLRKAGSFRFFPKKLQNRRTRMFTRSWQPYFVTYTKSFELRTFLRCMVFSPAVRLRA